MIIRTTKQIIINAYDEQDIGAFDDEIHILEPDNLDKEWVCLVDLKKEVHNMIFRKDELNLSLETINYLLKLCNSSEQTLKNTSSEGESPSVSVSGEHNTGEDDKTFVFANTGSKSSPVQNPVICKATKFKNVKIKPSVQKKCTCPQGFKPVMYVNSLGQLISKKECGRCGGAL